MPKFEPIQRTEFVATDPVRMQRAVASSGTDLTGLGEGLVELGNQINERQIKTATYEAEAKFSELNLSINQQMRELENQIEGDGSGYTQQVEALINAEREAFIGTVDRRIKKDVEARFGQYYNKVIGQAADTEAQIRSVFRAEREHQLQQQEINTVIAEPVLAQEMVEQMESRILASDMPDRAKREALSTGLSNIYSAEIEGLMDSASSQEDLDVIEKKLKSSVYRTNIKSSSYEALSEMIPAQRSIIETRMLNMEKEALIERSNSIARSLVDFQISAAEGNANAKDMQLIMNMLDDRVDPRGNYKLRLEQLMAQSDNVVDARRKEQLKAAENKLKELATNEEKRVKALSEQEQEKDKQLKEALYYDLRMRVARLNVDGKPLTEQEIEAFTKKYGVLSQYPTYYKQLLSMGRGTNQNAINMQRDLEMAEHVTNALAGQPTILNPQNPKDRDAVNDHVRDMVSRGDIDPGTDEGKVVLLNMSVNSGVVLDSLVFEIQRMSNSNDPLEISRAGAILSNLKLGGFGNNILETVLGKTELKDAKYTSRLIDRGLSPEKVEQMLTASRNVQEHTMTSRRKEMVKKITDDSIKESVQEVFSGIPFFPFDNLDVEAIPDTMVADYKEFAKEIYAVYGDEEYAKEQALQLVTEKYSVSSVLSSDREILSPYSPEKQFGVLGGGRDSDWMKNDIKSLLAENNLPEDTPYVLIPRPDRPQNDGSTPFDIMVKAGNIPLIINERPIVFTPGEEQMNEVNLRNATRELGFYRRADLKNKIFGAVTTTESMIPFTSIPQGLTISPKSIQRRHRNEEIIRGYLQNAQNNYNKSPKPGIITDMGLGFEAVGGKGWTKGGEID